MEVRVIGGLTPRWYEPRPGPSRAAPLPHDHDQQVFFCDPLISSGDIKGFTVQWDTAEDFEQAIESGDAGTGCAEIGFGSCVVTDAAVAGQCPYSLLLTDLTEGEVSFNVEDI